jgi:hypothetical protein
VATNRKVKVIGDTMMAWSKSQEPANMDKLLAAIQCWEPKVEEPVAAKIQTLAVVVEMLKLVEALDIIIETKSKE